MEKSVLLVSTSYISAVYDVETKVNFIQKNWCLTIKTPHSVWRQSVLLSHF